MRFEQQLSRERRSTSRGLLRDQKRQPHHMQQQQQQQEQQLQPHPIQQQQQPLQPHQIQQQQQPIGFGMGQVTAVQVQNMHAVQMQQPSHVVYPSAPPQAPLQHFPQYSTPQPQQASQKPARRKVGVGRALAAAGVKPVAQRRGQRSRSVPSQQQQQQQPQEVQQPMQGYTSTPRDAPAAAPCPLPAHAPPPLPPSARRSVSAGGGRPRHPAKHTCSVQEQQPRGYDKYSYPQARRPPQQQPQLPGTPLKGPETPVRQTSGTPDKQATPAPQDTAWERLVQAAQDDFTEEELAMLFWDTLSKLLTFYGIDEPMDVARIELTWKDIQSARSAAVSSVLGTPKPPTPQHCPAPSHSTRRPSDYDRSYQRSGSIRSCSPAQRPWM